VAGIDGRVTRVVRVSSTLASLDHARTARVFVAPDGTGRRLDAPAAGDERERQREKDAEQEHAHGMRA
jgi:hypothetical protein